MNDNLDEWDEPRRMSSFDNSKPGDVIYMSIGMLLMAAMVITIICAAFER